VGILSRRNAKERVKIIVCLSKKFLTFVLEWCIMIVNKPETSRPMGIGQLISKRAVFALRPCALLE
jgi:hypothetical protein